MLRDQSDRAKNVTCLLLEQQAGLVTSQAILTLHKDCVIVEHLTGMVTVTPCAVQHRAL